MPPVRQYLVLPARQKQTSEPQNVCGEHLGSICEFIQGGILRGHVSLRQSSSCTKKTAFCYSEVTGEFKSAYQRLSRLHEKRSNIGGAMKVLCHISTWMIYNWNIYYSIREQQFQTLATNLNSTFVSVTGQKQPHVLLALRKPKHKTKQKKRVEKKHWFPEEAYVRKINATLIHAWGVNHSHQQLLSFALRQVMKRHPSSHGGDRGGGGPEAQNNNDLELVLCCRSHQNPTTWQRREWIFHCTRRWIFF